MRSVDKKVCLMPSMAQKLIKNRLILSVAPLGIHHGLHFAWHRFVERVEALRRDAYQILPSNFFSPSFDDQLAPNLAETVPLAPQSKNCTPIIQRELIICRHG
jgi:hypothetical protein